MAAQLESARSKFKEFERKDVKARLCPLWNGANDGKSVLPDILLFHSLIGYRTLVITSASHPVACAQPSLKPAI